MVRARGYCLHTHQEKPREQGPAGAPHSTAVETQSEAVLRAHWMFPQTGALHPNLDRKGNNSEALSEVRDRGFREIGSEMAFGGWRNRQATLASHTTIDRAPGTTRVGAALLTFFVKRSRGSAANSPSLVGRKVSRLSDPRPALDLEGLGVSVFRRKILADEPVSRILSVTRAAR